MNSKLRDDLIRISKDLPHHSSLECMLTVYSNAEVYIRSVSGRGFLGGAMELGDEFKIVRNTEVPDSDLQRFVDWFDSRLAKEGAT